MGPTERTTTVKGAAILAALEVLREGSVLDEGQYAAFLALLPREIRDVIEGRILPSDRLPLVIANVITVAGAEACRMPVDAFGYLLGRMGAKRSLSKWYAAMIATALSPQRLLSLAPMFWRQLYSEGNITTIPRSETSATIELVAFPSTPASCARANGWFEALAEKAGVQECRSIHVACMAKGSGSCRWDLSWRTRR